MSDHTEHETGAFRPQGIEEIVDELQWEDGELVRALVALRLPPGHALRGRVRAITNTRSALLFLYFWLLYFCCWRPCPPSALPSAVSCNSVLAWCSSNRLWKPRPL
jgi:hypothetical protein